MKRLVIAAVVLALVAMAAVPVMADGKFTAWNQGNVYLFGQVGSNPSFVGWGPGWDNAAPAAGIGVDQEWSFGWDGKNIGFSGTFEFGNTGLASISWFGTYFKFGDVVKVTLGKPRIDYRQFTFIEGAGFNRLVNGEYSVTAELTLVKGLTIGLVDYVPLGAGFPAAAFPAALVNYQAISSYSPTDYLHNLGFGAMYAVPDLGTFMLQFRNVSNDLDFGANISAVKNIGIELSADLNFGAAGSAMKIATLASLQAAFAPLTVALDAGFNTSFASGATASFAVEGKVEYAMGMVALGILGGYDDGTGVNLFNQQCGTWDGVEVYPYVKANFDGGYIQLGFVYAGGANGHLSVIAVPIVYNWAF